MTKQGRSTAGETEETDVGSQTNAIVAELHDALNDIAGTHVFAQLGLASIRDSLLRKFNESDADPEQDLIVGEGDPNHSETFGYQRWRIGSLDQQLAEGGPVALQLGQQWIVLIHSRWEHDFRPRIAEASGVSKNEIIDAAFADIGRMRNDIIHHHGIATKRNTGKCEIFKWFEDGDVITITGLNVAQFMKHFDLVTNT